LTFGNTYRSLYEYLEAERMSKFNVGDKVKFIGTVGGGLIRGESGVIVKAPNPADGVLAATLYEVQFSSLSPTYVFAHELELLSPACPLVSSIGTKFDDGKPDMSLISTIAIIKIAAVLTHGKKKYAANNWRKGFPFTRISSAVLRHVFAWIGGESNDPETGISHLAHAACGLIFLLEFEDTHKELDDRYKPDEGR